MYREKVGAKYSHIHQQSQYLGEAKISQVQYKASLGYTESSWDGMGREQKRGQKREKTREGEGQEILKC